MKLSCGGVELASGLVTTNDGVEGLATVLVSHKPMRKGDFDEMTIPTVAFAESALQQLTDEVGGACPVWRKGPSVIADCDSGVGCGVAIL